MEKLKNLSRIALASMAISGGVAYSCSNQKTNIEVSDCTTVRDFRGSSPVFGAEATATSVPLSFETEFTIDESELALSGDVFAVDAALFPQDTDEPIPGRSGWKRADGKWRNSMEVPYDLNMHLEAANRTYQAFLAEKSSVDVEVYEYDFSDSGENLNGSATILPNGRQVIFVYIKPDSEIRADDLDKLIFHEGMHVVFDQIGPGKNFGWDGESEEIWNLLNRSRQDSQDNALNDVEARGYDVWNFNLGFVDGDIKLVGDLFNLVTESCYMGDGGHPSDNPDEMFASTATVMRFFPKSYLVSLESLVDEDKQKMERLSFYVLDNLIENANDKDQAKAQFDQEIIERFLK